jgi:predicted NBD/HSP70 family sugar kinase
VTPPTAVSGRSTGQQLDSLRRSNAAAVLSEIRARGSLSRSEIATNVGLSPAAITKIIAELERAGYLADGVSVEQTGARGRGRPRRPIGLNAARHRFVGVHVGLQRVTVGLVDLHGQVVALRSRKHATTTPGSVLSTGARLVRELVEQTGVAPQDVMGYSACAGGWVSPGEGRIRAFEGLGWRDVAFADGLRIEGLPSPRVESTVRALGRAEARLAAHEGVRNVLYVFVGNVIGCANVVDGTIAPGQHHAAGLIDHVGSGVRAPVRCTCGRRDCLWAVASDAAVTLAAQSRGLLGPGAAIEDLVAVSGTPGKDGRAARAMLAQRAARVGSTVAALIDVHDPELVIIGGGDVASSSEHFGQLEAAAHGRVAAGRDPIPIRPAALVGPPALVQGAATPALDAFYADPLGRPAAARRG